MRDEAPVRRMIRSANSLTEISRGLPILIGPVTSSAVAEAAEATPPSPSHEVALASPSQPQEASEANPAPESHASVRGCPVEVSNGAGRNGMAARFQKFLDDRGQSVRRLTNDRSFANSRTTIFYRPGHQEGAREIAELLSVPVILEIADLDRCDVRVRLGHDLLRLDQTIGRQLAARSAQ